MESKLLPYTADPVISCHSAIVFAPHPDDEVFGCGGALALHIAAGHQVAVVVLCDGAFGLDRAEREACIAKRQAESRAAAEILGYPAPTFWCLPDRGLEYGELLIERVKRAIVEGGADLIYAPSLNEAHPDHRALAMAVVEAIRRIGQEVRLAMYEVGVPMRPNRLLDITPVLESKALAMKCFSSQLIVQRYDEQIGALNRYRAYTLPLEVVAAEAFEVVSASDVALNHLTLFASEYQRQHELGLPIDGRHDQPLVSVIIRSMGRPSLDGALDSVALQTYPHVEVVIANALGVGHPAVNDHCGRYDLRMVARLNRAGNPTPLRRAQAGNLGLQSSLGQYLLFLDDDDWLAPDHLAKLMHGIQNHPGHLAVHTCIAGTDPQGQVNGMLFNEPYNPMRQIYGNLLPIHSVLFSRRLLDLGCAMDETFDLYEDWDFWLQVGTHTDIPMVPGVSGYYRVHHSSGVHEQKAIRGEAYSPIYKKWRALWPEEHLIALMHRLQDSHSLEVAVAEATRRHQELEETSRSEIAERDRQIAERIQQIIERDQQITERDRQIVERNQWLSERDQQINERNRWVAERNEWITERDRQIAERSQQIAERDQQLAERDRQLAEHHQWLAEREQQLAEREQQVIERNQWVTERDLQIIERNQWVIERDNQILALYQMVDEFKLSTSWRLTAPVRFVGGIWLRVKSAPPITICKDWLTLQLRRMVLLRRVMPLTIIHGGGIRETVSKGIDVYHREGLQGVRRRLSYLVTRDAYARTIVAEAPSDAASISAAPHSECKEAIAHSESVDLIVCVHNGLEDAKRCLESIVSNTFPPYHLIIVDDGCSDEARVYLENFAMGQPITLIRNEKEVGYGRAASVGVAVAKSDFLVLLDSSTIVPPRWIDRLIQCARSHGRIGIVGPFSNAAAWQSAPEISGNNGGSVASLPTGWSVNDYAEEVVRIAPPIYPRVGFVDGFCMLLKRRLVEELGPFDEGSFGRNSGADNDYCVRATLNGWQVAMADDCYVFHTQSTSYSSRRGAILGRLAHVVLPDKRRRQAVQQNPAAPQFHPAVRYMQQRCKLIPQLAETRLEARRRFEGKRVLFLLPTKAIDSTVNMVLLEAAVMREFGVDAWIGNLESNRELFERNHTCRPVPVFYLRGPEYLPELAADFDAVVATRFSTVDWLERLTTQQDGPVLGHYVQDFESDFFAKDSPGYQQAMASCEAISNLRRFARTAWTRRRLESELELTAEVVGPSVDADAFHPPPIADTGKGAIRLLAMVRPSTPGNEPHATVRILNRLKDHFGDRMQMSVFGVPTDSAELTSHPSNFPHRWLGELDAEAFANALAETDIFIDCSTAQAMSLTAMEAMAAGVAVVAPESGGLNEVVSHEHNGLLVDTRDEEALFVTVSRLVTDTALRTRIRSNVFDVLVHSPVLPAFRILDCLFRQEGTEHVPQSHSLAQEAR